MFRACPRCGFEMDQQQHGNVELDVCSRCRALYFDAGEFSQTPENADLGSEAFVQRWLGTGLAQDLGPGKQNCPDRHGPMHHYQVGSDDKNIDIDICNQCGGLWIEQPKLAALRDLLSAEDQARGQAQDDAGGVKTYLFQLFTGMPIEVYNPVRRKPVLLYNTIVLLFLAFAAQIFIGEKFTAFFALTPALISSQPWTLFTAALLHGGVLHILGNLYFFYIFGDNVEDRLGKSRFFLLLLASAFLGNLLYLIFHLGSTVPELGFSSAVAGVMAAYLVLFPKVKLWVVLFFIRFKISSYWYIGAWIGLQILAVLMGSLGQVAYWAHIGGFIAGAGLAWMWKKR